MKPDLPTNCREHANGRVKEIERHFINLNLDWEHATFLCGCTATMTFVKGGRDPDYWTLDETIFWKEGQA